MIETTQPNFYSSPETSTSAVSLGTGWQLQPQPPRNAWNSSLKVPGLSPPHSLFLSGLCLPQNSSRFSNIRAPSLFFFLAPILLLQAQETGTAVKTILPSWYQYLWTLNRLSLLESLKGIRPLRWANIPWKWLFTWQWTSSWSFSSKQLLKDQVVKIFGIAGFKASIAPTQLCHHGWKAATGNILIKGGSIPKKLYLQTQGSKPCFSTSLSGFSTGVVHLYHLGNFGNSWLSGHAQTN